MGTQLKRFSSNELQLSQDEAWGVIRFFWPENGVPASAFTDADREFAQGLLVEAIDASYNMGYVEQMFKAFYMKVPTSFSSIKSMVKKFAKGAMKHWFKHATQKDLNDAEIYESVRLTLSRNFRSVWKMREMGLDPTY